MIPEVDRVVDAVRDLAGHLLRELAGLVEAEPPIDTDALDAAVIAALEADQHCTCDDEPEDPDEPDPITYNATDDVLRSLLIDAARHKANGADIDEAADIVMADLLLRGIQAGDNL